MDDETKNNNSYKLRAAEWRGYVTKDLESIHADIRDVKTALLIDVTEIKTELRAKAGQRDIEELKSDVKAIKKAVVNMKIKMAGIGGLAAVVITGAANLAFAIWG